MFSVDHYPKCKYTDVEMFRFWTTKEKFEEIKNKKYIFRDDLLKNCIVEQDVLKKLFKTGEIDIERRK